MSFDLWQPGEGIAGIGAHSFWPKRYALLPRSNPCPVPCCPSSDWNIHHFPCMWLCEHRLFSISQSTSSQLNIEEERSILLFHFVRQDGNEMGFGAICKGTACRYVHEREGQQVTKKEKILGRAGGIHKKWSETMSEIQLVTVGTKDRPYRIPSTDNHAHPSRLSLTLSKMRVLSSFVSYWCVTDKSLQCELTGLKAHCQNPKNKRRALEEKKQKGADWSPLFSSSSS